MNLRLLTSLRFASITYGRPLGVNDKDCNVTMPADIHESSHFKSNSTIQEPLPICFSAYQRQLNMLYIIASPMIETIFGIRTSTSAKQVSGNHYSRLVEDVSKRLENWRQHMPSHLTFDFDRDIQPDAPPMLKTYRLQALALQLTFDNIIIILHRPFLAQQVGSLSTGTPEHLRNDGRSVSSGHISEPLAPVHGSNGPKLNNDPHLPSSAQWWAAAVRTSRVTEFPQLAQLATDSHLVAFLAINLFNSAIVMVVYALSDPLSDRAQEAKRNVTRIYRLQVVLGQKSTLSMQSSFVLQDVIHMLLNREAEAMLSPMFASRLSKGNHSGDLSAPSTAVPISVQDTLRLPLTTRTDVVNHPQSPQNDYRVNSDEALRLNESLASVQKGRFPNVSITPLVSSSESPDNEMTVFPGIGFEDFQYSDEQGQSFVQPVVDMDTWLNHVRRVSVTNTGEQAVGQGEDLGDGLYWIWNTITVPNSPTISGQNFGAA